MEFKKFSEVVRNNFNELAKGELFTVDLLPDELFKVYLESFPEGTNPIYKERTEHDCQCCKNFIRDVGRVVAIRDGKLVSIWNLGNKINDGVYSVVAKAMADKAEATPIKNIFKHYTRSSGAIVTHQLLEDGNTKSWDHFQCDIPDAHYSLDIGTVLGKAESSAGVYKRGLEEITDGAVEVVLDLIKSENIYRGEEFYEAVEQFSFLKDQYKHAKNKSVFIWSTLQSNSCALIRNTVIGTLLTDISDGVELEKAVASFESKVAPQNYKRTSAVITKKMVESAMKTVDDLGIRESLPRVFAKIEDVSVNNVLFVDRSVEPKMKDSIAELLEDEIATKKPKVNPGVLEEIKIEDFMNNVVPKSKSIHALVENKHTSNFMSIIAPKSKEAPSLLQWDNNFSWSYNGNVTDSIKQKVKSAGGNVEGICRVSLAWHNYDDLDLHVREPGGNTIYFSRKRNSYTSGFLDVDMNVSPSTREAVENIAWTDPNKIEVGKYQVLVHNYTKRESVDVGFTVEIECNGQLYTFTYENAVRGNEMVKVVDFDFDGTDIKIRRASVNKMAITKGKSQDIWGVKTETFVPVDTMMLSPNHWDDNKKGNKHYFFLLKNCKNPSTTRGLYNEFLRSDLTKHRKVFEVLGSKMSCPESNNQLSGVGFSSTVRNHLVCTVSGDINRTYKILF